MMLFAYRWDLSFHAKHFHSYVYFVCVYVNVNLHVMLIEVCHFNDSLSMQLNMPLALISQRHCLRIDFKTSKRKATNILKAVQFIDSIHLHRSE